MASRVFLVLGIVILGLWVFGYFYVSGLACAFGNMSPCSIRPPWALGQEDLMLLVVIPGAITVAPFLISWLLSRRR